MSAKIKGRRVEKFVDDDDIDEGDEPASVTSQRGRKAAAKNFQPRSITRIAVTNPPRGARSPRSAQDRVHNGRTGNGRDANQRTAEFTEQEIQQFMQQDENIMPYVPDTRDWHYKWARKRLGNKDDGANIANNVNGRLGYEIVTGPDMLPAKCDIKSLSIKSGDQMTGYEFSDCILMRCPMRNHKLAIIAASRRAAALDEMLDAGSQVSGIPGETRTGIVVEENKERYGVREVEPSAEEEMA